MHTRSLVGKWSALGSTACAAIGSLKPMGLAALMKSFFPQQGIRNITPPMICFCETDLPLQQFVQKPQLAANVMQADLHQCIVVAFEPLVGLPMHAFGFDAVAIQDARLPAHAFT